MFDYDPSAPLNLIENECQQDGAVLVKDVTYSSPVTGKPIAAYLVTPADADHAPAILYVHWYESHSETSNRTQFLAEAKQLARDHGVISLLPETMWSDVNWYRQGRTLDSDYEDAIRQVIELRRGLDVLYSLPEVDPQRVAFVGHDFGAMYGTLAGAADQRPAAYVLIAGASNFNNWMLFGIQPDHPGLDEYKAKMEPLAPARFVSQLSPAPVLLQMGTDDFYTPVEDIEIYENAAAEPKITKRYHSDHPMLLPEIQADRLAFLREKLSLR